MSKVTADTITDEQIRDLRAPSSEFGEGADVAGEYLSAAEIIFACDSALADHHVQCAGHCSTLCDEGWMPAREARARCAEILNARKAKS